MDNEKSNVVGVHKHYSAREGEHGRVMYWRSQVQRDGVITTLYYGLDKEEAERARIAYDRNNPDFDPYDHDERKREGERFQSKIFVDWPASKMSADQTHNNNNGLIKLGRTTVTRLYFPYHDRWELRINGVLK